MNTEDCLIEINKGKILEPDNNQLIQKAILEDNVLNELIAKKNEIFNITDMQAVIIGQKTRISMYHNADRLLYQIDEMIEARMQEIIYFYNDKRRLLNRNK